MLSTAHDYSAARNNSANRKQYTYLIITSFWRVQVAVWVPRFWRFLTLSRTLCKRFQILQKVLKFSNACQQNNQSTLFSPGEQNSNTPLETLAHCRLHRCSIPQQHVFVYVSRRLLLTSPCCFPRALLLQCPVTELTNVMRRPWGQACRCKSTAGATTVQTEICHLEKPVVKLIFKLWKFIFSVTIRKIVIRSVKFCHAFKTKANFCDFAKDCGKSSLERLGHSACCCPQVSSANESDDIFVHEWYKFRQWRLHCL